MNTKLFFKKFYSPYLTKIQVLIRYLFLKKFFKHKYKFFNTLSILVP